MRDFRLVSVAAARAADDKKAEDVALLSVKRLSSVADFLLLATIDSPAHLEAVEDHVEKTLKGKGLRMVRRDGSGSGLWRVLDYGGLLVHLMHRDARQYYQLDRLYHEARRVGWEPAPPAAPPAREKRKRGSKKEKPRRRMARR